MVQVQHTLPAAVGGAPDFGMHGFSMVYSHRVLGHYTWFCGQYVVMKNGSVRFTHSHRYIYIYIRIDIYTQFTTAIHRPMLRQVDTMEKERKGKKKRSVTHSSHVLYHKHCEHQHFNQCSDIFLAVTFQVHRHLEFGSNK